MKKTVLSLLAILLISAVRAQDSATVAVIDFKTLEPRLHQTGDTVYVINFWATWCKPCVKELPFFDKLEADYKGKPIKVLLVSLDFKKQLTTALIPFIQKHNIKAEVVLLSEPDANAWIDKVDKSWSGALPATVIYRGDYKEFYEKEFHEEELRTVVDTFISR